MSRALVEAKRGEGAVEPNPMVGAVVVQPAMDVAGGARPRLVAVGHHERFGGPHAEVHALRRAGAEARGATLYVTLEPCCHHGKTPPCTDAILAAGIARVVVAVRDPFPQVNGGGIQQLQAAGITVDVGCEAPAALLLNAPYWARQRLGRPYVTAKWAMTLDGKTATAVGDSRWISNARSRAHVHEMRGKADGVLVGVGTVWADDPLLTVRPPGPRAPSRVVIDPSARIPLTSRLVTTAHQAPVVLVVAPDAPASRVAAVQAAGCEVLVVPRAASDRLLLSALLQALGERGWTNLIVEGGGKTLGLFFDADLVDAVDVYVAPVLVGGPATYSPIGGVGVDAIAQGRRLMGPQITQLGDNLRIQGRIHGMPADPGHAPGHDPGLSLEPEPRPRQ